MLQGGTSGALDHNIYRQMPDGGYNSTLSLGRLQFLIQNFLHPHEAGQMLLQHIGIELAKNQLGLFPLGVGVLALAS